MHSEEAASFDRGIDRRMLRITWTNEGRGSFNENLKEKKTTKQISIRLEFQISQTTENMAQKSEAVLEIQNMPSKIKTKY